MRGVRNNAKHSIYAMDNMHKRCEWPLVARSDCGRRSQEQLVAHHRILERDSIALSSNFKYQGDPKDATIRSFAGHPNSWPGHPLKPQIQASCVQQTQPTMWQPVTIWYLSNQIYVFLQLLKDCRALELYYTHRESR